MRTFTFLLFLLLPTLFFSQNSSEQNVDIRMELMSVVEVNQLSQYYVKVANTENIILNYCDKYIAVPAGIHLLIVDINRYCHLVVASGQMINLEAEAEEIKIISNGMKTIDYMTGQIINVEDYIEYTICDTVIDKY